MTTRPRAAARASPDPVRERPEAIPCYLPTDAGAGEGDNPFQTRTIVKTQRRRPGRDYASWVTSDTRRTRRNRGAWLPQVLDGSRSRDHDTVIPFR